jgi:signal transduction histidine kinase
LNRAREFRPHVIILDVNLPDTDGHEVCRSLRADPVCAGIPVLMLTVRDRESDILSGLDAGADDYVAKDAAPEIFLARVRRLAQFRQMATASLLNEQLAQIGKLLAGIVHELRGPLAVVRGNAEILRLKLGEEAPLREWLDPILQGCQLLQVRIEHLMAAVRGGPSVRIELEIAPLLHETVGIFLKGIDPRTAQVAIDVAPMEDLPLVRGDAGRLVQVFLNLLGNAYEAITAVRAEGRVTVSAERVRDSDHDWLNIHVADDGPGIPDAFLGRLFEPFFTTKPNGSGYGLYLSSEILREHGGRLTAKNLAGGGACFSVWLPIGDGSEPRPSLGGRVSPFSSPIGGP